MSSRRNLFGKPTSSKDPWNEPMQEICYRLFDFLREEEQKPAARKTLLMNSRPYTQPEHVEDGPSQEAGEMDSWKERYAEVDESQNSFRKKSTAAEALAKLALGVKLK